jgi:hypothetical protein
MAQHQGEPVVTRPPDVDEVDEVLADPSPELRVPVQALLGRAPVEVVAPVSDQTLQERQLGSVVPPATVRLVWPDHPVEAVIEILKHRGRDVQDERLDRHHSVTVGTEGPQAPASRWLTKGEGEPVRKDGHPARRHPPRLANNQEPT